MFAGRVETDLQRECTWCCTRWRVVLLPRDLRMFAAFRPRDFAIGTLRAGDGVTEGTRWVMPLIGSFGRSLESTFGSRNDR